VNNFLEKGVEHPVSPSTAWCRTGKHMRRFMVFLRSEGCAVYTAHHNMRKRVSTKGKEEKPEDEEMAK
jgi:hypothetical protein